MSTMRQRQRRRGATMMPFPQLLLLFAVLFFSCHHGALGQQQVRINCGGDAFTDRDGNDWEDDSIMAKSKVESYKIGKSGIKNSNNKDELYSSELWDRTNPITELGVPVSNGLYAVSLHFAEIYYTEKNKRVFDLMLNDIVAYRDLDIYKEVQGFSALKMDFTTKVTNGVLKVGLKRVKQNPKISGIEIRPLEDNKPKASEFSPIRINCGGRALTDRAGNKWEKDIYHSGESEEFDCGPKDFRGTTDDILYRTERFDRKVLKYQIPNIPEGAYKVLLHFSENWFTTKNKFARGQTRGARVFDIAIQGVVQTKRFDIYSEAGEYSAVVREFPAFVDDGFLTIEMRALKTFPKVSGIEVLAISDVAPFREVYRWDNYDAQRLSLIVMNAMDSSWNNLFAETVRMWDRGEPDSLTLFPVDAEHDPECEAVSNQIVVCNGDYGEIKWTGLNTITLAGGYIRNSVARMNDYYLKDASDELKRYALCHEFGHAFGLPHTDEEYYNAERGDCLDYTVDPKKNMQPGEYNFDLLKQIYAGADRRILRYLKKKRKKKQTRDGQVTQEFVLPPNAKDTVERDDQDDVVEPTRKEVRLYTDFVTVVTEESCERWNKKRPTKQQATLVESNKFGEVCELEFGKDMVVQVRKLYWFDGWKKELNKKD